MVGGASPLISRFHICYRLFIYTCVYIYLHLILNSFLICHFEGFRIVVWLVVGVVVGWVLFLVWGLIWGCFLRLIK